MTRLLMYACMRPAETSEVETHECPVVFAYVID